MKHATRHNTNPRTIVNREDAHDSAIIKRTMARVRAGLEKLYPWDQVLREMGFDAEADEYRANLKAHRRR
jgi:hypothetical protein